MKSISAKTRFIKPRHLLLIFLVLAVLMVSSAIIELQQSRKELLVLLTEQANTLSQTIIAASRNTLMTNMVLEDLIEERLLNHAALIQKLYHNNQVSNDFLKNYSRDNNLYLIDIFQPDGNVLFSSHPGQGEMTGDLPELQDDLTPIFGGESDTLILGLQPDRREAGYRFAVAIAGKDCTAIEVNLDADQLLEFRRQIGFGSLLGKLVENPGIVYAALQDTFGILAASGNVEELESISGSEFMQSVLPGNGFKTRQVDFNSRRVFEAVHPFLYEGEIIGLLRIGISLEPLELIKNRIYRRISIISLVLLLVGFILFTLLIINQNLEITRRQYQAVETYSRNIIQKVSDVILVYEDPGGIKIFNQMGEKIFGITADQIIGKRLDAVTNMVDWEGFLNGEVALQELTLELRGKTHHLLISKNHYQGEDEKIIHILLLRDLTELKQLEAQVHRRERLSALGQFASGVAHEIRNPLNTIGTAIQQLDRDFIPEKSQEEYHQLTRMIYQEVKRINATVEDFLRFARPAPLKVESFDVDNFFTEIVKQYTPLINQKGISLALKMNWKGRVNWDRMKMKQVFGNLLQNAVDVLEPGGRIHIILEKGEKTFLQISVIDSGPGIPDDIQKKIFNLYFTTKPAGTGIGLSLVQQLVDLHQGSITLESESGKGTIFILKLPISVNQ